jgi:hypothetical protein
MARFEARGTGASRRVPRAWLAAALGAGAVALAAPAPAEGPARLGTMVGTWHAFGMGPKPDKPGATVTVAEAAGGQPRVQLTYYIYRDADGKAMPDEWVTTGQALAGKALTFSTLRENYPTQKHDLRTEWEFTLAGTDEALLREIRGSVVDHGKVQRGEAQDLEPPMKLKRAK